MFDKILVANRGEIALRVFRTAHRLGVQTVAVFSDADANSKHTKAADESVHIGPSPATESYLRSDKIIEAALKTKAQAIHPGYGFLSENADFADACKSAGLIFIGPPGSAIRSMGSKSGSKIIMEKAGVPCTPGYHGSDQSISRLKAEAQRCGFPLMLKADAGGGGKGMRIVERMEDFEENVESCRREALSSFKDDKILMERYVRKARHVEFQIFGDGFGNYLHLYERDCSVQRRHQKVLEEAPAPHLSPELRLAMGSAAVQAARAVGYQGAGTVEFMVDADERTSNSRLTTTTPTFYFMEMNTRLQVEHPVTEMVTGLDLVEWQLRVASGEKLPITNQSDVPLRGHSIEARIYAENPKGGFLPGAGDLKYISEPPKNADTRLETGVGMGDKISIYYDPMISKLVVRGDTRIQALKILEQRLAEYDVAGLSTNIEFVAACARHPKFIQGGVATSFIAENHKDLLPPASKKEDGPFCELGWGTFDGKIMTSVISICDAFHAMSSLSLEEEQQYFGFRQGANSNNPVPSRVIHIDIDGKPFELESRVVGISNNNNNNIKQVHVVVQLGNNQVFATGKLIEYVPEVGDHNSTMKIDLALYKELNDDKPIHVVNGLRCAFLPSSSKRRDEHSLCVFSGSRGGLSRLSYLIDFKSPDFSPKGSEGKSTVSKISAPMPGKITRVLVKVGDDVKEGQVLVAMEAMKMEHVLKSPKAGKVTQVFVSPGALVGDGLELARVA
jgi:3-methylcrotonyl-CoA carboxylase alpha subunit